MVTMHSGSVLVELGFFILQMSTVEEVQEQIRRVESKIEGLEKQIEARTPGDDVWALLMNKEAQLRNKEAQLRDKEKQLRDKEAQLASGISLCRV